MVYTKFFLDVSKVFMLSGFLVACSLSHKKEPVLPVVPYLDDTLSFEQRADDLIARMTLEEKAQQMLNAAPAIERLGVPEYNWWSEALHGVARAGLATVFPQAIGLAATWDEPHMYNVASAISDEARAKHHAFAAGGKHFIYQGLTLWSPNINLFRDPRWGRGQETYGEDPYLTGRMAYQFIKGLQGDDPKYLKTVATVKHFAVHSGPEPERHEFDATTNMRDLYEFYLPQFEVGVREAGAYSLMCAYNRYNGEAACGSDLLLNKILRKDWAFDGFVVSDCGAILDIHKYHKVTATPEESAALAVKSGTDLNCGKIYSPALVTAVQQGLIEEAVIDLSLKRLFVARMKLGMFDASEKVAYTQIPYDVVNSKKHQQLALESARKSIVLLKNKNNALPLKKDIKTLAVVGPNADQWLMLLGNYNGVPSDPITPLRGIQEKLPNTRVIYAQGSDLVEGHPVLTVVPNRVLKTPEGKPGLKAEFYGNSAMEGDVLFTEVHTNLNANWNDKAPRADMDDDNFGIRWTGTLTPDISGNYLFALNSTCNTELYIDGKMIRDTEYHFRNEYGDPRTKKSEWIQLTAGQTYQIKVQAKETFADAQVALSWAEPAPNQYNAAINAAKQADAVVMFMGLTAQLEGEEMKVAVEGFRGGDRTDIGLPKVQEQLIKDIHALGKPVVLVLLNGSALAVNWAQEHVPAIVEAWYPGQAGGAAIADVLFGDYNPAGRLPVTFYKSMDDLPALEDYNISTQTYRYYPGEVLYPFGYGLSYSQFEYSALKVADEVNKGVDLPVTVTVKNTSAIAGEEVVQVYLQNKTTKHRVPLRALVAFKRVMLKPGQTKTLTFNVPNKEFAYFDEQGQRQYEVGDFSVSVGGGQPDQVRSSSNILRQPVRLKN